MGKMSHNMEISSIFLILVLALFIRDDPALAGRTSDKIYSNLQSNHYCSRRLNATHQVGCSSKLGGNLGIVWVVESDSDLDHILKTGKTPPYVAVMRREYFTLDNLKTFKSNLDRVSGVVFLDNDHEDSKKRSTPFSPDDICPNRYSGLYVNDSTYGDCKQHAWQRKSPVSGLLYEDIPYPIFLINDKDSVSEIESCFERNILKQTHADIEPSRRQGSYPLCGMQLDSFMTAAKDSKLCLNSHTMIDEVLQSSGRRCQIVGGLNIFGYYKPAHGPLHETNGTTRRPDVTKPQSIVMLTTKLSSLGMFTDISPGADSTITSIVTLLAAAEALKRIRDAKEIAQSENNIAFAIIDSEPFDYTGSSRMVHSMATNSFPYSDWDTNTTEDVIQNTNLKSLKYVINLDQMALYPGTDGVHLHTNIYDTSEKVKTMQQKLEQYSRCESLNFTVEPLGILPPSSVQEFIKQSRLDQTENKLTGVVLSNYGQKYSNYFYNSIYDDSHNVYQSTKVKLAEHIASVAKLVALTTANLAFGVDGCERIVINKTLVEEMLDCYLTNAQCGLFTKAWQAGQRLPDQPIQTYKDPTRRSDDMNGAITGNLLAYFIGDHLHDSSVAKCYEENKNNYIYNFHYVNGRTEPIVDDTSGVCIRSQVTMLPAHSPAFSVGDEGIIINHKYPAWTVSLNNIRNPVRIYMKPSPVAEILMLLFGVLMTFSSIIVTHLLKRSFKQIRVDLEEVSNATST